MTERGTRTNAKGEFALQDLPQVGFTFDFYKTGYSDHRGARLKTGELNKIQISTGGAINGIVFDERDKPVRNFNIRVSTPRVRNQGELAGDIYVGFMVYGINFTRDDGLFTITDINANHWERLIVSAPGIGLAIVDRAQSSPLDQLPDPAKLKIRLKPFVPLDIDVEEATTGKAIPNATVGLIEDQIKAQHGNIQNFVWNYSNTHQLAVSADGRGNALFREPGCEDGTITVTAPGYGRQRLEWTDREERLTVTLTPEARLQGEVRLNGQLLKEGYLSLKSPGNEIFSTVLSEKTGRFEFDQLPAGEFAISLAEQSGKTLYTGKLTLEAGKLRVENIDLTDGRK
ncbi:MAG: hypothetical protein U0903_10460 [Planctomycetales bacterium]